MNESKKVSFYIASGLENAKQVSGLAHMLKLSDYRHTYDWTQHGSVQDCGSEEIAIVSELEYNGVKDADAVIVILPGGRGTHTELGIALADTNKKVILCAENEYQLFENERTCSFYYNSNVTRVIGRPDEWLYKIIEIMTGLEDRKGANCYL